MRKQNGKKLMGIIIFLVSLPVIYMTVIMTIPLILPLLERAAVYSAFMSFTPKNVEILKQEEIPQVNFIEDSLSELEYYDDEVEYEEPSPVSSGEKTSSSSNPSSQEVASLPEAKSGEKPANAGTIERKTYTAGNTGVYININEGFIKNCTTISAAKILENVKKMPDFKIKANSAPEVLIMHTHATESYQEKPSDYFDKSYSSRTTDNKKNMIRIGDEIEKQLSAAGIGVIHDKTLHDYPSYNGSYERSAATVKRILKENPTIKVVLDVHRDAIQPSANTMIAPVTTINGKSSAQVMIISGCDDGTMNMPNYMQNLKFSAALQRQMEKDYKTLARPILFDYRKYNQNLTTGSILLEVGGHGNTLDEAIYCGEMVGKAMAKTLLAQK